jgi:hypothetical protein
VRWSSYVSPKSGPRAVLRYSDAQRTTSTEATSNRWPCMPVLAGDVRRVASSVAIVEPIASRHPSPLTAFRRPYRFKARTRGSSRRPPRTCRGCGLSSWWTRTRAPARGCKASAIPEPRFGTALGTDLGSPDRTSQHRNGSTMRLDSRPYLPALFSKTGVQARVPRDHTGTTPAERSAASTPNTNAWLGGNRMAPRLSRFLAGESDHGDNPSGARLVDVGLPQPAADLQPYIDERGRALPPVRHRHAKRIRSATRDRHVVGDH